MPRRDASSLVCGVRLRGAALALLVLLPAARSLSAQLYTRPQLQWETIRTSHFDVYFPATMDPWAREVAARLESIREAVVTVVGNAPAHRVTIVIDDPYNLVNGAALPLLNTPTIVLWPTPPDPTGDLGNAPGWPELLAVHEFTHIAHLTWPSRNPFDRVVWELLPANLGPIARRAPRWVMEGYATYVEGRLTGSGRPNSAARAAVIRQFALDGQLPAYDELDASPRYLGGDMAYLMGSAFLEWLVAQPRVTGADTGDISLQHLWRRMSAQTDRTFERAFAGVFGDSPQALYGRFTAEVTGNALQAARLIAAAGLDTGETFQRLSWYTGDPAVAPDGRRLAIPVRRPGQPTQVVVWSTAPLPADTARAAAAERTIGRDSLDVPSVPRGPPPRPALAILDASHGRGFDDPRFFADGERLLVIHNEPLADGALRPDLFEWLPGTDEVRRITHGASVRDADPAPDGKTALAVRCRDGICDVVSVDLANGALRVVLAATPTRQYYRPRFAPDGRSAIVSVHDVDRWRLEVFDIGAAGIAAAHPVGPTDGASRFGATYVARGTTVVAVSDLGGEPHLELIDLQSGETKLLAATSGGTGAPSASPVDRDVYFLTQSARGRDLHRVALSAAKSTAAPVLPPDLAPAAVPATVRVDSFAPAPVPAPITYGMTPRNYRYLIGGALGPEGDYVTLLVGSSDPVGRLSWTAQGSIGDPGTWRGVSVAGAYRGFPVTLDGSVFAVSQFPSRQSAGSYASDSLDANFAGAVVAAGATRYSSWLVNRARIGLSAGGLEIASGPARLRDLLFASYVGTGDFSSGELLLRATIGAVGSVGQTEGTGWQRLTARGSVVLGYAHQAIRYSIVYSQVGRGAPAYEVPVAGGSAPPLTDPALLTQRIAVPALPIGVVSGTQLTDQHLEYGLDPLVLYFERLGTPGRGPFDLYGAEVRAGSPPVPFLAVPAVAFSTGIGYSISDPFKYKLRAYIAARYEP